MGFKLGQAKRKMITPNNHVPVYKRNLDKGILGEAYKDGSIAVDTSVKEGSQQYKDVVAHEMDHAKRMKTGELDYGTDFVRWRGKTYPRKDGKIKYDGKWKIEGHRDFPWEKIADKAMDNPRPPKSALKQNKEITTKKEERKIKRDWSESRKAKYKETEKGMKELGIDKIERKYRDLRYPYQDDKKIKMLKRDIAELKEKANNVGEVNKNRILNKIEKLKAKLPKRVQ
jgi:hypothetical protein